MTQMGPAERARLRKARTITAALKVELASSYGAVPGQQTPTPCDYCGEMGEIDWSDPDRVRFWPSFEIDHYFPFRLGGETTIENLRLACLHCNRSKGMNPPEYITPKQI